MVLSSPDEKLYNVVAETQGGVCHLDKIHCSWLLTALEPHALVGRSWSLVLPLSVLTFPLSGQAHTVKMQISQTVSSWKNVTE